MANFLRLSSRLVGRRIHTSAPRKFDPVPTVRAEIGSDLQALKQKEKGPWSALTKEEKVACELEILVIFLFLVVPLSSSLSEALPQYP